MSGAAPRRFDTRQRAAYSFRVNIEQHTLERLTRRIKRLSGPPSRRTRDSIAAELRSGLKPEMLAETFIRALDGSVEDAAAIAAAFRPDWECSLTPQGEGDDVKIIARITAPAAEGETPPRAFTATRSIAHPALALLAATLESAVAPDAPRLKQAFGWNDLFATVLVLGYYAIWLVGGAAILQVMWELFWESW